MSHKHFLPTNIVFPLKSVHLSEVVVLVEDEFDGVKEIPRNSFGVDDERRIHLLLCLKEFFPQNHQSLEEEEEKEDDEDDDDDDDEV